MPDPIQEVLALFASRGGRAYPGEPVSQTEHALQAAMAAEGGRASAELITAALLHDFGHLLDEAGDAGAGIADRHEAAGAAWLGRYFGAPVVEPIRLHVEAKRYLCATEGAYFMNLSEASVRSLAVQGGPMTEREAERFRRGPHAEAAVRLRRWDESAKVPGLETPPLEYYLRFLEAALGK